MASTISCQVHPWYYERRRCRQGQPPDYLGRKGRALLQRDQRDKIYATVADTNKVRITFPMASAVAEEVLKSEYDVVRIIFNRFVSAIAQKPTLATVLSPMALEKEAEAGGAIDQYEIEGPDRAELLQDLAEFQLATTLFSCLLENNCSEQSSRMSAMENSTRECRRDVGQADPHVQLHEAGIFTTELIEIISGATALADA